MPGRATLACGSRSMRARGQVEVPPEQEVPLILRQRPLVHESELRIVCGGSIKGKDRAWLSVTGTDCSLAKTAGRPAADRCRHFRIRKEARRK